MRFFKVLLYIAAFVVAVYMALFFNSYYALAFACALVAMLGIDVILFLLPLGKISAEIFSSKTDYVKGEKGKVFVYIRNTKIFPIYKVEFDVTIKNKFYEGEKIKIVASLPILIRRKITVPLVIERSGVINIKADNFVYSDMFGIFRKKANVSESYSVLAMPKIVETDSTEFGMAESDEIPAVNVYLSNDGDVSGYKEYGIGDRKNNINWKIFARSQRLYVKEFERTSADEAVILLDMNIKNIDKALDILYSLGSKGDFTLLWLPCGNEVFETAYICDAETLRTAIYKIFNSAPESIENKGLNEYKRLYRENRVLYISDKMELV